MALRVPESKFWDHFYRPKPPPKPPIRPSRNPNRTSKSDFWPFYWFLPFSHWNSHWSQKKLRTAEGVVLQQKQKVFRNLWTKWNNLKPCRSWNFNFHQNKNHPTVLVWFGSFLRYSLDLRGQFQWCNLSYFLREYTLPCVIEGCAEWWRWYLDLFRVGHFLKTAPKWPRMAQNHHNGLKMALHEPKWP